MRWTDVEKKGIIKSDTTDIDDGNEGFKSKDQKFDFLVPCFLYCYSWLRPADGKNFVMYDNKTGKKIEKYPILPLVTALIIGTFSKYNSKYEKLTVKDLFVMQGLAFHKNSFYYKQWKLRHPLFYKGETPPRVFQLALERRDKRVFDDISFPYYEQYITKTFFRQCFAKVLEKVESILASLPNMYQNGGSITKEYETILDFFVDGAKGFFSRLGVGKDYYNMNDEEHKTYLEDSKPLRRIQRTITYLMNGIYEDGYEKVDCDFRDGLVDIQFADAWDSFYEKNKKKIDDKMRGIDEEKYRYEIE